MGIIIPCTGAMIPRMHGDYNPKQYSYNSKEVEELLSLAVEIYNPQDTEGLKSLVLELL